MNHGRNGWEADSFAKVVYTGVMAQPPRLESILLPLETEVIYFVTLCVSGRERVLTNDNTFAELKEGFKQSRRWQVLAAVIMPDHLHAIVSPRENRELSVGDFSTGLKRMLRKRLNSQAWDWQRGCFDRLTRSDEKAWQNWQYLRENPVRHDLVSSCRNWPYFFVASGCEL